MKFSPNNFYIGIIDLFAIILPGCIVSLILYYFYYAKVDELLKTTNQSEFLSAFILIFSSYLFGHIISQLSAYLDKWVYDQYKDKFYKDQTLLNFVKQIRAQNYHNSSKDLELISSYEWAEMKLHKEMPQVVQEAERYVADSKFFRSLLLILFVLIIPLWVAGNYSLSIICFLIAAFSLVRYFHKRQKATKTLYKGIVFVEKLNNPNENKVDEAVFNEEYTNREVENTELTKTYPDLWKYFTDDAAKIKDRMWTIASWMYTLQGALLAYIGGHLSAKDGITIEVGNRILVLIVAGIGFVLSGFTFYMIYQYGDHIRGMWNRADLVRRKIPGLSEIWLLNNEEKLDEDREVDGHHNTGLPKVALRLIWLCVGFMLVFITLFLIAVS